MKKTPIVYIIAGPNGAGKTTFAIEFLPKIAGCRNFINADLIARGLSPLDVDAAAIAAGRIFLTQIRLQMDTRHDFAFETTLAGLSYVKLIKEMLRGGYHVHLYYLWLPGVQLSLKRIAERVKRGGHDIPSQVVVRRYGKGLINLFRYYIPLADYCAIFDNTMNPTLIYERSPEAERIMNREVFEKIQKQAEGKQ